MTYEELKYNKNRHEIMERAQLFYETYTAIRKLVNLEKPHLLIWNKHVINYIGKAKRKSRVFDIDRTGLPYFIVLTLKQKR